MLSSGEGIKGNVIIDSTATVEEGCEIGPNVVIGPGCHVHKGAKVLESTLLAGSVVKEHSYVKGSILGWKSTIGKWCRVTGLSVIAEDV